MAFCSIFIGTGNIIKLDVSATKLAAGTAHLMRAI